MISNFAGMVGGFSKEVMGTMKTVANSVFKTEGKKSGLSNRDLGDKTDDMLFFANPIMKSLIILKQQLDQLVYDKETKEKKNELLIKDEVIDLLDLMLDLRQDYLLSNVIDWYQEVVMRLNNRTDGNEKSFFIKDLVKKEIETVLPGVLKTGIDEVDAKYTLKETIPYWKRVFVRKRQPTKTTKFVNYTNEQEIPDLDALFEGVRDQKKLTSKGVLPSLLVTFVLVNDTQVENKLLALIMKIFSQKEKLAENLRNLEIIYDRKDVAIYSKIEKWIEELRLHTQRSEVRMFNPFIRSLRSG